MRKKLLTIASLSLFYFTNAQLSYFGDGALVQIQDNALFYVGGGVKLDGTAKVTNVGDFMVVSSNQNFEVASTADFRLQYANSSSYGQLYIQDMPQANITGKVNKEYVDIKHGVTGSQQTALPFSSFAPSDLLATLPYINVANSALTVNGRWNSSSAFKWNNTTATFDQLTTATTPNLGKPTDYYILPRKSSNGTVVWDPTVTLPNENANINSVLHGISGGNSSTTPNTMKKIFQGVPVSDADLSVTAVDLKDSALGISFGINGVGKNKYGEKYSTYIDDPFVTTTWGADYGKNMYQFGNPFLTNIDLSLIKKGNSSTDDENAISNLNGLYYYTSGVESNGKGTSYTAASMVKVTFDSNGGLVAGQANDLLIKPMQAFVVKLSDSTPQTLKFNKTRRFAQTARPDTTTYSVTARTLSKTNSVSTKQLGVVLLDANNQELGRTFYVVNEDAVTGFAPSTARMQATADNSSIYTNEEQLNGGADTNANYKLYINEANENDFQGKEIKLVVNNAQASKMKFFLIDNGSVVSDNYNLSNGKSFYFGDNGALTRLDSGTVLPLNNTNYTYSLFYEQPQKTLATNELLRGQTLVVKNISDYFVRFNKNWKSADIEIYSVSGQLVHSAKKVNTSSDYKLPLQSSVNTVYVVKIMSDNGEVVTKKIIK